MSAGRIVLIIVGALFVLGALSATAAGGAVVWASQYHKDSEGFHVTDPMRIESASYAAVSDTIEINRGASKALDWLGMDRIKVRVENDDPHRPVFLGIAKSRDVDAFLSDVRHDEIDDVDVFDSSFEYDRKPGSAQPEAPGSQGFWLEQAEGTGAREIVFDLKEGKFAIVAMNADASEGIEMETVFGIKSSGVIVLLGVGLFVLAAILLAGGVVMLVFGARKPRPKAPSGVPPQQP